MIRSGLVRVAALSFFMLGGQGADAMPVTQSRVGVPGCDSDVAVNASREALTFKSRGRDIRVYLYAPAGEPIGEGVVLLHGGTGFEMNSILFDAHAIQLASRGYWVLLPAYFDAAKPDRARRVVAGRAWRQAALDAAAELRTRAGIDAGDVVLWGYSRGAGVAIDAATFSGSGIRSAVLVAGGGEIDDDVSISGLSVLLMHARRDEAVPVAATLSLAEELREAGAAIDVRELDFDGHRYDLTTWCAVMNHTRAFLEGP